MKVHEGNVMAAQSNAAIPANLDNMSLAAVREYRAGLSEEEEKVSYWRRLVQTRIDLIEQEKSAQGITTKDLLKSLGSTGTGARRQQLLSVEAQDELPDLPGLNDLWMSAIDIHDAEQTADLLAELQDVETRLSVYRRSLHARIDAATAELVRRYKENPDLSLELFPTGCS